MILFFLMGCTCAGKGTFIKRCKETLSNAPVGYIEVGQEFRRRYPPEHFQGQANPAHLMQEALDIFQEGLERERAGWREVVIVDGQPRQGQVEPILKMLRPTERSYFILLHAPGEVRAARATQRCSVGSPEHTLILQRLHNDYKTYYKTLAEIHQAGAGRRLHVIDTNRPTDDWFYTLTGLLDELQE